MDFNFNDIDLNVIVTGALKVLLIVVVVFAALFILKRAIRKIIEIRIHKPREESPEELAKRTDTLSGVLNQVVSVVIWAIAFVMILSVFKVDIAPLIAAIGVAGLALGFAAQNIEPLAKVVKGVDLLSQVKDDDLHGNEIE